MNEQSTGEQAGVRKRRWWVAFLSILVGIGYLYVGRPIRYWLFLLFSNLLLALLFVGPSWLMSKPATIIALGLSAVVVCVAVIIDVVRLAVKQPDYKLQWYNRWWVYLASVVFTTSLALIPDIAGREALAVRNYSIPSESNVPTMMVGDYITGNPKAYDTADPQRGDVAVFRLPSDNTIDYVKRIVGLPGDRVQMIDGVLHINGVAVPRKEVGILEGRTTRKARIFEETLPNGVSYRTLDIFESRADNTQEYAVPAEHYFLMGDNRDNSTDSRFLSVVGYVPRKNIYAKIDGVIYSRDWSRIGTSIK